MISKWINRKGNSSLILFFNGWGMDENVLSDMNHVGFDVLMIYDYTSPQLILPDISNYSQKILIAWSMGVWAASEANIEADIRIAINGTPMPVDDVYGINVNRVLGTIDNWSSTSARKFNIRMMGGNEMNNQQHLLPQRSIDSQKVELQSIYNRASGYPTKWDKAIIGSIDLIFSTQNQQNYWCNKAEIALIEMPHWPFGKFNNWQSIIGYHD